jgi:NTP pyrophosphatase (non-canonical NTP hydrolase)
MLTFVLGLLLGCVAASLLCRRNITFDDVVHLLRGHPRYLDALTPEQRRVLAAAAPVWEKPLTALGLEANDINRANGWNVLTPSEWADPHHVPACLALIHSEVSEALEDFRKDSRLHFGEELADIVIRVLDCGAGLGYDLDFEVIRKLERNRLRAHKHGGKRI